MFSLLKRSRKNKLINYSLSLIFKFKNILRLNTITSMLKLTKARSSLSRVKALTYFNIF